MTIGFGFLGLGKRDGWEAEVRRVMKERAEAEEAKAMAMAKTMSTDEELERLKKMALSSPLSRPDSFMDAKVLFDKDAYMLSIGLMPYKMAGMPEVPATGPQNFHYGTRISPKGMRFAVSSLADQPTALSVLVAMMSHVSHGCVVRAARKTILETTKLSASSYTRAVNVLLAHGFIWPNTTKNTYEAGYFTDSELPKNINGARYKIGPFLAFRGPREFKDAEVRRYGLYMKERALKRLTPEMSGDETDNICMKEIPNE